MGNKQTLPVHSVHAEQEVGDTTNGMLVSRNAHKNFGEKVWGLPSTLKSVFVTPTISTMDKKFTVPTNYVYSSINPYRVLVTTNKFYLVLDIGKKQETYLIEHSTINKNTKTTTFGAVLDEFKLENVPIEKVLSYQFIVNNFKDENKETPYIFCVLNYETGISGKLIDQLDDCYYLRWSWVHDSITKTVNDIKDSTIVNEKNIHATCQKLLDIYDKKIDAVGADVCAWAVLIPLSNMNSVKLDIDSVMEYLFLNKK